ncbi:MAG: hypothetical protein K0R47_4454 [Brevibacillus sp.]|nr:hypothetical protein [Brevibacillus sp.]
MATPRKEAQIRLSPPEATARDTGWPLCHYPPCSREAKSAGSRYSVSTDETNRESTHTCEGQNHRRERGTAHFADSFSSRNRKPLSSGIPYQWGSRICVP